MSIYAKLALVQSALKAPKNKRNTFSDFNYRSLEDICEAVKPLLIGNGLTMYIADELIQVGDRYYIKATATVAEIESGESITVSAYAREAASKPKFDDSQLTGSTSSYARKYALNGLFLIDDTKDADTDEYQRQAQDKPKNAQKTTEKPKPAKTATVAKNAQVENADTARLVKLAAQFGLDEAGLEILVGSKYKIALAEVSTAQVGEIIEKIKTDPEKIIAWVDKKRGLMP